MGTDLRDWNEEKRASFDQLNQVVIQEQQLVSRTKTTNVQGSRSLFGHRACPKSLWVLPVFN